MTNVQNDLRTRRMESWSQTQEGGMLDEEAHREKKVETWSRTKMCEVDDAKTRCKKEDKKSQVETWSQTHAVGLGDEIPQCRKGAKNVWVESQDWTRKINVKEMAEEKDRHVEKA